MPHIYTQLSLDEREKIQRGLWEGKSLRAIARELKRSGATLSRELRRNGGDSLGRQRYTPRKAQERAHDRIVIRGRRLRLKNMTTRVYVQTQLRAGWSPEQIAGRLSRDHPTSHISHEAIYQYIYTQYRRGGYGACTGTDLRRYLRRRHKVRHPKKIPYVVETGSVRNKISIDERPVIVDTRTEAGHWEGDSMISRANTVGLNSLVERRSGLLLLSKLANDTAKETSRVVVRRLCRIPQRLRQTLTIDNGHENARHQETAKTLQTNIYFAHPYHSWERGTNENTNGLVRWYLPKRTDFATIPESTIEWIEQQLNTRSRKRLDWQTPLEVFNSFVLH